MNANRWARVLDDGLCHHHSVVFGRDCTLPAGHGGPVHAVERLGIRWKVDNSQAIYFPPRGPRLYKAIVKPDGRVLVGDRVATVASM